MSEEKQPLTEEQKQNNRFSFTVGIMIGLVVFVIIVVLSLLVH
jgi:ABC-type lipoprotein release transport system permease subunit